MSLTKDGNDVGRSVLWALGIHLAPAQWFIFRDIRLNKQAKHGKHRAACARPKTSMFIILNVVYVSCSLYYTKSIFSKLYVSARVIIYSQLCLCYVITFLLLKIGHQSHICLPACSGTEGEFPIKTFQS